MKPQSLSLQSALADAYVLGQLSALATKRFGRWLLQDAQLRQLVSESEQRWHRLAAAVPPMPVSEVVWKGVECRLFPASGKVVPIKRALSPWKQASLVAASLLLLGWAGLVTWTSLSGVVSSPTQVIALVLDDERKATGWQLAMAEQGDLLVEALVSQPSLQARVYQLWVIPAGMDKPISLGLIPETGERRLSLTEQQQAYVASATKFGVSIEPLGGSPTGQPTSPAIYHGQLAAEKKS